MAKDPNAIKFDLPSKEISALVDTFTGSSRLMNRLAEDMVKQIRDRTRLGFGVTRGGRKKKLEGLSNSYKEQRKGNVRFFTNKGGKVYAVGKVSNKDLKSLRASKSARKQNAKNRNFLKKPSNLDSTTKPSKSNLTATGRMLNALTRRVVNRKIFITLKNSRGADMFGNSSNVTTNQKATLQAKAGRRFLDLAIFEQRLFRDRITKKMLELSKKILKS